jgi:Ras-related protein Rab-1A
MSQRLSKSFVIKINRSLDDANRYLRMVIEENGVLPEACYLVANKVDILKREVYFTI